MNWPGTVGRTGRAKITVRSYTGNDGREYQTNDVKQFLESENAPAAPAAAQSWTPGAF